MMKYIVVSRNMRITKYQQGSEFLNDYPSPAPLIAEVNKLLKEGYKPCGGISVVFESENNFITFYQALIKE